MSQGELSGPHKVAMLLTFLIGQALTWVMAIWEKGDEPIAHFDNFLVMFRRVFNHAPEGREVGKGRQSVVEFAKCFRMPAAESEWNDSSQDSILMRLKQQYPHGAGMSRRRSHT